VKSLIEIDTRERVEIIDITSSIEEFVRKSGIENGICLVYTLHTTTGLTVNEAERGLIKDMCRLMSSLIPEGAGYLHDKIDSNAHAHLQALLLGNSVTIPVDAGRIILGTWQRILFIELDGPRRRRLYCRTISE
jgi:secondary thiamine-phosphate synthase enzyme